MEVNDMGIIVKSCTLYNYIPSIIIKVHPMHSIKNIMILDSVLQMIIKGIARENKRSNGQILCSAISFGSCCYEKILELIKSPKAMSSNQARFKYL